MKRIDAAYIIARNTDDGAVEYWTGKAWTFDKASARTYRTLQAVDKAKVENEAKRNLYITE